MKLFRVYFVCRRCRVCSYALDDRLGVIGSRSPMAERLICLAGASWSFDGAAEHLREFCGLAISDNSIRAVCQQHGSTMSRWQHSEPEAVRPFREADGDIEFTTDGTSVNTTAGWREMKLAIFSKRQRGESATPEQWDKRSLPAPHVRLAFAAIERSERFGSRWKQWSRRLGILDASNITVLADGAKWIWEEQLNHLRGAEGVLDIFHALEHIAETARCVYGEGTDEASQWLAEGRTVLLSEGFGGIERQIRETRQRVRSPRKRQSLDDLHGYLSNHAEHLHYSERLAQGRAIGSGQVEGACKNLIGRRLKQTGARWRFQRVNRMAGLCSIMYSKQWNAYWNTLAT